MKTTSNKDNLRDEDNIKKEDDLNMKMVSIWRQPQIKTTWSRRPYLARAYITLVMIAGRNKQFVNLVLGSRVIANEGKNFNPPVESGLVCHL